MLMVSVNSLVMWRRVLWGVGLIVLILLVYRIHSRIVRTVLILLGCRTNEITVLTVRCAAMIAGVSKWFERNPSRSHVRRICIIGVCLWLAHRLPGLRMEIHHQHLLRKGVHN